VLRLQAPVLLLDIAQPLQLTHRDWLELGYLARELAIAHLLAPLRQHEWVNA